MWWSGKSSVTLAEPPGQFTWSLHSTKQSTKKSSADGRWLDLKQEFMSAGRAAKEWQVSDLDPNSQSHLKKKKKSWNRVRERERGQGRGWGRERKKSTTEIVLEGKEEREKQHRPTKSSSLWPAALVIYNNKGHFKCFREKKIHLPSATKIITKIMKV